MTLKEGKWNKQKLRNRINLGMIMAIATVAIMVIPSTVNAGISYQYPPYAAGNVTRTLYNDNAAGIAHFQNYTTPWETINNGHFYGETKVWLTDCLLPYKTISDTYTFEFYSQSFAPPSGTMSYTLNCMWDAAWHVRMSINKLSGGGYAFSDLDVIFGFWSVTHSSWVGTRCTVHIDNHQITSGSIDHSSTFGATAQAWTLEAGHSYRAYAEILVINKIYSSTPMTHIDNAEVRTDVWNWGDAKLPDFLIAY